MCDRARVRYESCMEERGMSYGMAYEDARDFDNACTTWTWEQGVLGEAPDCAAMSSTFENGTCEDYDAAW
jgi:hypothetical protein